MLRARSLLHSSFSGYFELQNFHYLHPPISTTSDCEGGSATFGISPKTFYSNKDVFLSVSSQLYLEAAAVGALSKVWTISPTFRAEPSDTNRHLSEFWMLEAEICFINSICKLTDFITDLIRHAAQRLLDSDLFTELQTHLSNIQSGEYPNCTYSDAIEDLASIGQHVKWGSSLSFEQEQLVLDRAVKKNPKTMGIFITGYPEQGKPFYMKRSSGMVENFDFIVRGVGELAGGSLREDNLEALQASIRAQGLNEEALAWYLDTRKYGSVPHGGFGIGFDRVVQWMLEAKNIRECIFMPRAARSICC